MHYKILALLVFTTTLSASVVTSGTIEVHGVGTIYNNVGSFSIAGDGFAATGEFWNGNWVPGRGPYLQGETLYLSGDIGGDLTFRQGTATIDGVFMPYVDWSSSFVDGPAGPMGFDLNAVPITMGASAGVYQSTFNLTGSLCGTGRRPSMYGSFPCIASVPNLAGSGTVQVTMVSDGLFHGEPLYRATDLLYTFSAPAPQAAAVANPEPATWLLLLLGYGAVMAYARSPFRRVSSFIPPHVDRAQ